MFCVSNLHAARDVRCPYVDRSVRILSDVSEAVNMLPCGKQ